MIAAGTRMPEGLRPTLILFPLLTAALIYWIWIMIIGFRLHHPCPERCYCITDPGIIDCSDAGLQNAPENTLGELLGMNLEGNNYSILRKDMFQNKTYTRIELLSFARCNVSVIEAGAFDHISVLLRLTLEENNITDIPPGVFHNLKTLEALSMASNNIEVVRSKVFKGLESLTRISLQNNSVRYFETDAFWGLFNLRSVYLTSNKIIHLQSDLFSKIPRLYHLDLSGNMIDIPSHTEFLNSDTITSINLDTCNIRQLSENTFRNMTSLQRIWLGSNRLTYVNPNTFSMLPTLSAVDLDDNPLICDCNLKETYSWFVEHNIYTGEFVPRCNEPSEVNGLWWGVMESGKCKDMVIKYHEDVKSISENYTDSMDEEDLYTRYKNFKKYLHPIRYLMFYFGTVGNVIIILIILCNKELRTIPNMYIINLAIGDLMTLISAAPVYDKHASEYQKYFCIPFKYITSLSRGVTSYSVAILSIQRYEVIVRPFVSRIRNLNPRRTVALHISSVWILASLFTLVAINCKDIPSNDPCFCVEINKYTEQMVIFQFVVYCILPLCVIATMYILTASHLIRSKAVASEETPQHQRRAKSRATTVKTILSRTLVFVVTLVPLNTFTVYVTWTDSDYEEEITLLYLQLIAYCLHFCNACFNPVALFYASSSFKKFLKSFLCCRRKKRSNQSAEPAVRVVTTNL